MSYVRHVNTLPLNLTLSFHLLFLLGGTKDSQNVDLFSGTEKSHHRTMKRNKSADDVLSPGVLYGEEEYFSQLGSHSASSSRENVTSFTVPSSESPTFDPFHTTRTKSPETPDDPIGGNSHKGASPDLFDPFSSKHPTDKPSSEFDPFSSKQIGSKTDAFEIFTSKQGNQAQSFDPFASKQSATKPETFDPFGSKSAQSSRSTETFQPFGSKSSGTNLGSFGLFGAKSKGASEDLLGMSSSQAPTSTSQAQTKSNADLFGDWGGSSATPLQPNKMPSPTPPRKTNGSVPQSKPTSNDPFADFGNLKSSLPKASAAPKFPTASTTSPKAQRKPGPGTSASPSWSRTTQQASWQSGTKPSSPPKAQKKPNYTPSYSMSGSSGVFGNYGQKWNGEC